MRKIVVFLAIFVFFLLSARVSRAAYLYIDAYGNLSFTSQVLGEATGRPERPPAAPAGMIQIQRVGNSVQVTSPLGSEEVGASDGVDIVEVEESAQMRGVRVRARGNALEVEHRRIGAITHFPLSVNTETNELTVTTPAGSRVVTVLPDQAVANMLSSNIFDFLLSREAEPPPGPTAPSGPTGLTGIAPEGPTGIVAPGPETPEVEEEIELAEENGVLVYRMRGIKRAEFLGLFPFQFLVEATVSAETGELITVDQPPFYRFFNFLFTD